MLGVRAGSVAKKAKRVESEWGTPGGLGCVANTGLRKRCFRICGNGWTYRRIFGCVARKGLRGKGIVTQGSSSMGNARARAVSDYQTRCYHRSIVLVKIELREIWK